MMLAQSGSSTVVFTSIFWITIGAFFASAIIGAILARRRRDRCLKLLHDHHVTLAISSGRVIWGDIQIFSQGLELVYAAPYRTGMGLIKSSYLMYESELGKVLSISRFVGDLTAQEFSRRRQVHRRVRPSLLRRTFRSIHNLFNTVRDAINKTLTAFIGQVAKSGHMRAMQTQQGEVNKMGQSLLNAVGNAYEPMLERHIGCPVVLELTNPTDPEKRTIELIGHLA